MMRLKRPRERDEAHLDFIRSLPCVSCGNDTATEAAHLRAGNLEYGKRETGLGEKPSDRWTLPLCSKCHREQHQENETDFWTEQGLNPWVLAMGLFNATGDYDLANEVIARQRR